MEFELKSFNMELNVSRLANIHYFEFTNKFFTLKDSHPFRELVYVDNGSITVESENYCGTLLKNQMILHNESEIHSLVCPEDKAPNVIIIGFECNCPELDRFAFAPVTLSQEQQWYLTEIVKNGRTVFMPPYDQPNIKDMQKRSNLPFGADQMIKLKLELFLISLIQNEPQTSDAQTLKVINSKIAEIHEYLLNNYRETLNLDELCFLYNTNKTTLCSGFKQAYNTTVIDFVNRLRIKDAKNLLRERKQNVTQISALLGFSSVHYFSRIFKKYVNLSPREYVKSIKSKLDIN